MSDIAIRVENLSKRYRIGLKEEMHDTMMSAMVDFIRQPIKNLRRLRQLSHFEENGRGLEDIIWALKDVSFEVKRGEVVGIIGRNGAGKTTLLKILSHITEPTSGRAEINGRVASLLAVGTGFHSELTGRENVYLNGTVLGMKKAEVERKFDEIVDFSGVEKFIDTPVKRYSSGMYVRLAFAVAAHLEPEILLVDEVLAVGDIGFQKKCLGKMENVAQEGRTVLFVSHNMAAVNQLCERALLLSEGHLLADGPTEDTVKTYVSSGLIERPEYSQPPDRSKAMQLRRMFVVDDKGHCQPDLRYDKPFKIIIEYDVNTPVRGCGVAFSLRTLDEIRVFTTADYDADPEMLSTRHPGSYRAEVTIPGQWLKPNRYKVWVFLTQQSRGNAAYDSKETIAFQIIDTGTPYQRYGTPKRTAVLQPILPWSTRCQQRST